MRRFIFAAVLVTMLPEFAAAQVPVPHEKFGDDPAPDLFPRQTGPAGHWLVPSGLGGVQVNVDENGNDILNDAANEPSIGIDPSAPNRMVIGWRQFDNVQSNFRQAGYAWSNDGGRSWHFEGVLKDQVFLSDPVVETDSEGNFYYYSLDQSFNCWLFKSLDGGRSWLEPVYGYGGDKTWMAIDKTGGMGDGHIYGIWKPPGGFFTRSSDGGNSFEPPVGANLGPIRGTVAVGPDGEVYVFGQTNPFGILRSDNARLADQTVSFPLAKTVDLGGTLAGYDGPNPGGILGQAWVDVDRTQGPKRGWVYALCSVDPPGADRCDVTFARSEDGGQTWSEAVEVTGEPGDLNAYQWFGMMAVAPNGRIDAVWNDTSEGDSYWWSELRYSYSGDQGRTWSPPEVLSPQWSSQVGWPNQNKIGDYCDMESDLVGANVAWAATFTGGQDVYYLRIGDYDCNGNGVGDAEDLAGGAEQDCDADGIPDSCEIAAGAEIDANGDGIPDFCQCYGDYNFDGALNLFDFLAFVNEFNPGMPRADCDRDGEFSLFDFLCFVNAFNEGC